MLPKDNRLQPSEIRRVLRAGHRLGNQLFGLSVLRTSGDVSRFACIVSTKVDKRAVMRNRIKRLMREAIWILIPRVRTGFEAVIAARPATVSRTQSEIAHHIDDLFLRAGMV